VTKEGRERPPQAKVYELQKVLNAVDMPGWSREAKVTAQNKKDRVSFAEVYAICSRSLDGGSGPRSCLLSEVEFPDKMERAQQLWNKTLEYRGLIS
jgi:hypothetical protein